ncbi:phosphocholine cytidylyltransferase family protein [Campylobacter felis]|uniref:Phosphocholine cytidylyltransferase family protein n=1 Tax=Campylobacter felis TaxID=2974565 RepID=A0ABT7I4T5_9BACT|nr:phosphocholine cytidylyltransferase family protein [Campylobacter upsaliensis]MDL0103539.1 phosphocholine cytidylyltransferase family protein [Campylobacter felis]MDL0108350.1 phosphocholine cytidylyltransferase family protein [Campylobacter felis]MDL0146999.1 phosphocholine cytidylyltransferase family protein [Campylobacter felis]
MKALILAAGFGSRLMPLTEFVPKTMVKYQGKALIEYEITALKEAGVSEIAVVGGYLAPILREFVANFSVNTFYENKNYDKTNMLMTLFCAREFMQKCIDEKQDLIISYADIVYFKESVAKLMETKAELAIVVDKAWRELWQRRFEDPLEDAESLKFKEGKIIELGKKPSSYADIEAQYIGLFKFSHAFLPKMISFYESLDRKALYDGKDFENMYMTSFLQALIDKFDNALAVEINGGWCEIDFKKDLEIEFVTL